jgi:L-fucose mutarotase
MLIGIPPVLGPDLLQILRAMGHGDEIALVDGNYPAVEHGKRVVRADGIDLVTMLAAVTKILPVEAAFRASHMNDPAQRGPIHQQIEAICRDCGQNFTVTALSGDQLYPQIRNAFAIVATSEMALYANVILRKGVLNHHPS